MVSSDWTLVEKEIIVKNLTKMYGGKTAIHKVSFEVDKGDLFVIMGPSPCGKSVLLKCIQGLEKPDSGSIYIAGQDMKNVPPFKRDVSIVFQNYALFPHMRVAGNIAFGLKMRKHPIEQIELEVDETMKLVGLSGMGDRRITELSGGQQQRVALARSLVVKPKVLLFDEPLGNLDFKLQLRMMTELKSLHQALNATFLYVTHSREQAMSLGTKIMVMNQGAVEQIGTPDELYNHPASVFVARFVGDINILRGGVVSVEKGVAAVKTDVGSFFGKSNNLYLKGKTVAYAVRPEHMYIGSEAKDCDNRLEARYVSEVYKGSSAEYVTQIANGREFKVLKPGYEKVDIELGMLDSVLLGWDSEDVLLIEKPSAVPGIDIDRVILGA